MNEVVKNICAVPILGFENKEGFIASFGAIGNHNGTISSNKGC